MSKRRKILSFVLALAFVGPSLVVAQRVLHRKIYIWFPAYLKWTLAKPEQAGPNPTDILLLVADHFEPGRHTDRVRQWVERYPQLFAEIRDSDGLPPRHTWFYPAEQFRLEQLQLLNLLVEQGFGEIELHLHHENDTSQTLREKLRKAKENFGLVGALRTVEGETRFGFAHGNWALDNSIQEGDQNRCGVNDELSILVEEGAFGDFTFPAYGTTAQPQTLNALFYAYDDPAKPKSYNSGIEMAVGSVPEPDGLLILQGPLIVRWFDLRNGPLPMIDYAQLEGDGVGTPDLSRFRSWIEGDIHVQGRPEWILIKNHTHGASTRDMALVLSERMAGFYRDVVEYSRENNIRLHFVTAREAYNIVKAAEAGYRGNPNAYRDFEVAPYLNTSTPTSPGPTNPAKTY